MINNKNSFMVLLIILAIAIITMGCSVTTANVDNAVMTTLNTDFDEEGRPVDMVANYNTNATEFMVWAELHNAPDNTTITFVWYYEGDKITSTETSNEDLVETSIIGTLTLPNDWPEGNYTVEIYIDDREQPDQTVEFTVSD
jgi:hypothetical protein